MKKLLIIALATTLFGTTQQLHSADDAFFNSRLCILGAAGLAAPAIGGYLFAHRSHEANLAPVIGILTGTGLLTAVLINPISSYYSSAYFSELSSYPIIKGIATGLVSITSAHTISSMIFLASIHINQPAPVQPVQAAPELPKEDEKFDL